MDEVPATVAAPRLRPLPIVVVMGVSGCGKSVVGTALADRLGCRFVEGDRLHPSENVARMASGVPLTDEHRWGWLDVVGGAMAAVLAEGSGVIAACSALKRSYRDRLRLAAGPVVFVHLDIDRETAARRVGQRRGHFMPATLIDSQFADLEPPGPDESAMILDARLPVSDIVAEATRFLVTSTPEGTS